MSFRTSRSRWEMFSRSLEGSWFFDFLSGPWFECQHVFQHLTKIYLKVWKIKLWKNQVYTCYIPVFVFQKLICAKMSFFGKHTHFRIWFIRNLLWKYCWDRGPFKKNNINPMNSPWNHRWVSTLRPCGKRRSLRWSNRCDKCPRPCCGSNGMVWWVFGEDDSSMMKIFFDVYRNYLDV